MACSAVSTIAHATTTDRVMFSIAPKVAVKKIHTALGVQKFLVASNTPFSVVADGMIGEVEVEIVRDGVAEGQTFGSRSQFPGPASHCQMVSSMFGQAVYQSDRKTAHRSGSLLQQAVMVIVRHNDIANPNIRITAGQNLPVTNPCT